jgi:hypothetical protein
MCEQEVTEISGTAYFNRGTAGAATPEQANRSAEPGRSVGLLSSLRLISEELLRRQGLSAGASRAECRSLFGKVQRRKATKRKIVASAMPMIDPLTKSAASWMGRLTCGPRRPKAYRGRRAQRS